MSSKDLNDFLSGKNSRFAKSLFISLLVSFATFFVLYMLRLRYIDSFTQKYGFYLFFSILSYSIILSSLNLIRPYKDFPCMGGMMVGMTIGMISGFLPGFFIGATNGMFYGGVSGMLIGIVFGVWAGKCCGIMGIMEGIMAGFMGGLMGAMTAIMMFNDHLKASGVIVFLVSSVILGGLNFMIFKETKGIDRKYGDNLMNIVLSFILTLLTIIFSVYGPRSSLLQ